MPTEIRHIVFSDEELYAALREYRERRRAPMPSGPVERIRLYGETDVQAVLTFKDCGSEVEVYSDEIAMALILYCIDRQIPLPVESTKFIQVFGGSVGLVINRNAAYGNVIDSTVDDVDQAP